ncbi:MAG: methyltransferase domain-containing protein [Bacteroidota bacterium]
MTFSRFSTTLQVIKTHHKIHPPLIKGIASALFSVFGEGKYADKAVPQLLKENPKWGSKDRRFVAENTYELVRYWRKYWHLLGEEISKEHAALERLVAIRLLEQGFTLPDDENFAGLTITELAISESDAVTESYPEWLYARIVQELGERGSKEAQSLNDRASVFLRVNTSKISTKKALKSLEEQQVPASLLPGTNCIRLEARANLDQIEICKKGQAELQDSGSQLIAPFLDPKPGSLIIDACAGSGGKSLHLADLTNDGSPIISLDIEHWKLKNLLFRANKSGFQSIVTYPLPDPEFFKQYAQKADYLLLDVPCSGLGVIKRNPDTKWKLTEERLEELIGIQQDILSSYINLVKPGGICVYATCSILPSENTDQVHKFLKNNSEFSLLAEHMQWPSQGTDGFYMARLQRSY